jgi:hypothetical protein
LIEFWWYLAGKKAEELGISPLSTGTSKISIPVDNKRIIDGDAKRS